MTAVLFVATAVCVGVLVWSEFQEQAVLKAVSKTLASTGFITMGVWMGLPTGSSAQKAFFAGLVLGMAGDLFLLSREKRYFLLGLVSFLLNHVFFVVGFVLLGVNWLWAGIAAVPLVGFAYGVWRWLAPTVGKLGGPVMAYIAVISVMVACAVGGWTTAGGVLLAAAVLFFVSDLCVARDRFVVKGPQNKLFGLPLYYAGQLLFAWGAG